MQRIAERLLHRLGCKLVRSGAGGRGQAQAVDAVAELCARLGVVVEEPPDGETYRRMCKPLFPSWTDVPRDFHPEGGGDLAGLLENISMRQYFRVKDEDGVLRITDDYPESHYYSRQRMLAGIYRNLAGGLEGKSVLDIGCSSGYYSFHCVRMGAGRVLGTDARPEHEEQFRLLRMMLGIAEERCAYRHVDMETGLEGIDDVFDVVLAQGVMYHVYDHPRFVRNLHRLTKRVLVLEGGCSGRTDFYCKADMEDTGNLRASIHGPVLYPSLPWMVELLRWVGFEDIRYVRLPADVPDRWGFGGFWRAMLVALKS